MGLKISDKAKDVISAVAPVLGAALGGPLGGLAGNVLATVVGGGKKEDVDAALVAQSPDTLLKLKEAEQQFKVRLRELDISEQEVHAKDRQSARDMAKVNMTPQILLSTCFIAGYFGILALFFVGDIEISDKLREPFLILIGVITANVPAIMNFWFGSSVGSKEKTELLGAPR